MFLAEVSPETAFWLAIIAAIAAAVSPLINSYIQSRQSIKLAEINARTKKIETETEEIKTEAKGQGKKLDKAMVTRKKIARTQKKQIDEMQHKSGPQPVTVENTEPIKVTDQHEERE